MKRVLILGGGFAGAAAGRGLGRRLDVTIVSQDNFLLFTPMLAEAAAGDVDPRHIVTPIRQLAPHARLVQGTVRKIDPDQRSVEVKPLFGEDVIHLQADSLVIALGSVPNTFGVPGVEENSLPFKTISDALRIRNRLLALLEHSTIHPDPRITSVVVIGAGYSGAEAAGALADFLHPAAARYYKDAPTPAVALVDAAERVTPALSPALSKAAARALVARGVDLALGSAVAEVAPGAVRLGNGQIIEAATVIWTAGVKPNPLIAELGLPTDKGRLVVDRQLRAAPGVFAAGDAALSESGGGLSPPTAQFAIREGRYLGRHLPRLLESGRDVPAFRYSTKGELVSLGHRNAVGRVLGIPVSGFPAWFLWRTYYLWQLPSALRKARVAIDWTLDLLFPPDVAWIPSSDLGPN
ncbi:MAG TPA: NAD(P)/FAD-dependent oxidoreductase [Acidimicrobiia bacterium]|nr:NAD(P)/FAD-dependent oxidoreductase [Acidimicrobiia bacterium]